MGGSDREREQHLRAMTALQNRDQKPKWQYQLNIFGDDAFRRAHRPDSVQRTAHVRCVLLNQIIEVPVAHVRARSIVVVVVASLLCNDIFCDGSARACSPAHICAWWCGIVS